MKKFLGICFVFFCTLLITNCNKVDGDYYNYANKNATYNGTIYDYLVSSNEFDSMSSLLRKVNLLDTLKKGDSLTIFAFENISFKNAIENLNILRLAQNRVPLNLNTLDSSAVDSLICKYILPKYRPVDSIKLFPEGIVLPIVRYPYYTMNLKYTKSDAEGYVGGGPQFIAYSDMNLSDYSSFWVTNKTKSVDIRTLNGIIHILEDGHEFGFSKASTILNTK